MSDRHYYEPGHPWCYVLGGPVLYPSGILAGVRRQAYQGYRTDIDAGDRLPEPQRSAELRRIRSEILADLRADLSRYRGVVSALRRHRRQPGDHRPECADVHVSVSLKHNHLANDFAHLLKIDALLAQQPDLFSA